MTSARRYALTALLLLALSLAGAGRAAGQSALTPEMIELGAGLAAQLACAGVVVTGRPLERVLVEDVAAFDPQLAAFPITVSEDGRVFTAGTPGGRQNRRAYARPGLGCTLVPAPDPGGPEPLAALDAVLPGGPTADHGGAPRPDPWPRGDGPAEPEVLAQPARDALEAAVDEVFRRQNRGGRPDTRAVLVIHDGRLVAERYAPGFGPESRFLGWSMAKSVMALGAGLLVSDGKLALDAPVPLPAWRTPGSPHAGVTLRHLLQMTVGQDFTTAFPGDENRMLFGHGDMAAYVAALPAQHPPGAAWNYSSGASMVLARLVTDAAGGPAPAQSLFHDRIFAPIGVRSAIFQTDATGVPVGASYLYATARDWARLGQLVLDRGRAAERQVVPEDWITFLLTPVDLPGTDAMSYGGQVWLGRDADGGRQGAYAPRLPDDAAYFRGHNGQVMALIPSRRLVILRLGWTPDANPRFPVDDLFPPIVAAFE